MTVRRAVTVLAIAWCFAGGCGVRVVELDPGEVPDASIDGPPPDCIPGDTQCTNCVDDDEDGFVDGFDVECTGSYDDDEGSFGTGRQGDNGNNQRQDCFFDGNSGSDEGCDIHTCCELVECPADIPGPPFDPETDCVIGPACVAFCEPLVPPGCDCFGCCTVCTAGNCIDVYIHPAVAPDCTGENLGDAVACPRCTPSTECGVPCGGTTCILCPGQTVNDLPPTCTGATCPGDEPTCVGNADCAADEFCVGGCCVAVVE